MNRGLLLSNKNKLWVLFTNRSLGEQSNIVLYGYKEDYGTGIFMVEHSLELTTAIHTKEGCVEIQNKFLDQVWVRFATPEDAGVIYQFVKELAEFEKMSEAVQTTENTFTRRMMCSKPPFQCLIAMVGNTPVGFSLFYPTYSTWVGEGMYLDDLYIAKEYQGRGVGKLLFEATLKIAAERRYKRVELSVLSWNSRAIALYENSGMKSMEGWQQYRMNFKEVVNYLDMPINSKV